MKSSKKTIKQFNDDDKFLSLNVYQFPLGNCGGFTDTLTTESIYIPCDTGNVSYKYIENDNFIFIEEQRSERYFCLIPIVQPLKSNGTMSGGNLATTSDSRCKHIYKIHDRFENVQKYYDVLSPDGFSISMDDMYSSPEEALKEMHDWIEKRYKEQGYYSRLREKIPFEEIHLYCNIVEI